MMASFAGRDIPAVDNRMQNEEEMPIHESPSPRSSTDYSSSKATSSHAAVSKQSSNPSSAASDTQGNNRANNHLLPALIGIGSQFTNSARARTILDEIEIGPNADKPSPDDLHGRGRQQQRRRRAVTQSNNSINLNDRMREYLESQDDPFYRSDIGQLSTQKGKKIE